MTKSTTTSMHHLSVPRPSSLSFIRFTAPINLPLRNFSRFKIPATEKYQHNKNHLMPRTDTSHTFHNPQKSILFKLRSIRNSKNNYNNVPRSYLYTYALAQSQIQLWKEQFLKTIIKSIFFLLLSPVLSKKVRNWCFNSQTSLAIS